MGARTPQGTGATPEERQARVRAALERYEPSPAWLRLKELEGAKPAPRFGALWVLLLAEAIFLVMLVILWWRSG
jgi:hypothetical protein